MVRSLELICRIIGEYLNRGVRWSDLLFRSYSVAMWRLDWKSQGEAGNSEAMAASQLSTPESYTKEVALGRAQSEQIQGICKKVHWLRFADWMDWKEKWRITVCLE